MQAVYNMTGVKPPELDVPDMPESLEYLWRYYIDLKNAGDVNFSTIKAFSDLMALDLQPFEVSLIMDFEKQYRQAL